MDTTQEVYSVVAPSSEYNKEEHNIVFIGEKKVAEYIANKIKGFFACTRQIGVYGGKFNSSADDFTTVRGTQDEGYRTNHTDVRKYIGDILMAYANNKLKIN